MGSAGIQQCVMAFSTGAASASDMSATCRNLGIYEDCLASKAAGCSAAQTNAFVGPVESAKSSLNCQEDELANNAATNPAAETSSSSEDTSNELASSAFSL